MEGSSFYVLFESSSGFALFSVLESEQIATLLDEVQNGLTDLARFQRVVKMVGFLPFTTAENALENMNAITEHELSDDLKTFLQSNIPKSKKGAKHQLGVIEPLLAQSIQENLDIPCRADDTIRELTRGIRLHFTKFVKPLGNGLLEQAQLGLGHSYSRSKVKFNPARTDNMIIQAIALLDQLDKDLNTFAMRVREWYSWHFPELKNIVKDNYMFARCAALIQDKSTLAEDKLDEIAAIIGDDEQAKAVLKAAKASMGFDISEQDLFNVVMFTERMISLAEYRKQLYSYLEEKMATVAPNLSTLIGETVAARLIQKAGSLTNLAKCPASTVQILGAEKALFRALKTKGNTPKYGLIYHSTFIGRASAKNKGRISRYLANKCSLASRIDSFIDEPTKAYGEQLRDQVEERLKFYDTGDTPRKNLDVMTAVSESLRKESEKSVSKDKKKKNKREREEEADEIVLAPAAEEKKKSKKSKKEEQPAPVEEEVEEPVVEKKKKKKDKN